MPNLFIIAGSNGSGKTTTAMTLLPQYLRVREFVNADEIARGLSPFYPDGVAMQAGRIMLERMHALVAAQEEFAFETTLASKTFASFIKKAKTSGYKVHLIFLWIADPLISIQRVALRVSRGGHHIPENVIRRRHAGGIHNFKEIYMHLVDSWELYDNMLIPTVKIAQMTNKIITVYNQQQWKEIQNL
jgi:predicted ABC-type ATPase